MTEIPYPRSLNRSPLQATKHGAGAFARPDFPDFIATSGPARLLNVHRVGFSPSGLCHPYLSAQDRTPPATGHAQAPRVMLCSVPPCCPHPLLILPGLLSMPLPPVLAESGLQGGRQPVRLALTAAAWWFASGPLDSTSRLTPYPFRLRSASSWTGRSFTCKENSIAGAH
jgi:hypothetical protein